MHMADALVSPATGGVMWAAAAALIAGCGRMVKGAATENVVPMMGVLGAFVFTAQMINFTIPLTGSSGHLGGGLLLAVLLGPPAAFLVIASVLTVQALFFADGGLLALGCNIVNLGFFPAFIAWPLVYRPLAGRRGAAWPWIAAVAAAVAASQLGAFSVVLQTRLSGISDLPFRPFLLLMQPIHLAIGAVEGLVTAAVVAFVAKARPETLMRSAPLQDADGASRRRVVMGLLAAAILTGGALSWFASSHPDGLEWALMKVSGKEEVTGTDSGTHQAMARIQERTAILPDYGFRETPEEPRALAGAGAASVSGLAGGAMTLALAGAVGLCLRRIGARP